MSIDSKNVTKIKAETLAYWYLRLNGFLTITNFIVHPNSGYDQRTDVDVIGIRFPYREELLYNPMQDDTIFKANSEKPLLVFTEVKSSICDLNGPWTKPQKENMQQVLRAIGTFKTAEIDTVSKSLYKDGNYEGDQIIVKLLCVGGTINPKLQRKYKGVPQIIFDDILSFIYNRFTSYYQQKASHNQWDKDIKALWNLAIKCSGAAKSSQDGCTAFISDIKVNP